MRIDTDSIHVLHVDDQPGFADVAREFLERADDRITVTSAHSARAGLDRLASEPFDCVVSDYDMPDVDGLEFLEAVRDEHGEIPFVLFTGKGSEEVASDAISAGVTDYLQKGGGTDQYTVLANRILNAVERSRSQRALERSRNRLSSLFEQSPLAAVEWNQNFEVVRWNEQAEEVFGYTAEEAEDRQVTFIVPEHTHEDVVAAKERLLERTGGYHGINENVRKDGEVITCEWHNRIVTDENDDVQSVISLAQDVTGREQRKRRLEALIDTLPGIVYRTHNDPAWPMEYVGGECERLTGYSTEELESGDVIWGEDVLHPEEYDRAWNVVQESLAAGEPFELTYDILTADGERKRVWERGKAVGSRDGELEALEGFITDVIDHNAQERALEELHETSRRLMRAESRTEVATEVVEAFATILDMPMNTCWLYDEDDDVLAPVAWTDAAESLGEVPTYESGEGISWSVFESGEPATFDDVSDDPRAVNPETQVRSEMVLPLGEHGVINVGSTEVAAYDENHVSLARLLAANAETAMTRADRETELRRQRRFVDQTLNAIDDAFYAFDTDGKPIHWNETVPEVTGYDDEEVASMTVLEFFEEADRDRVAEAVDEVLESGHTTVVADLVTKNGTRIPYEFTGSLLTDAAGDPTGFVGVGRDVSDRRERERQLERKNERLETFTSMVSHDLRSPLEVAQGHAELARAEGDSDHLDELVETHERMGELVDDLLTLAKAEESVDEVAPVSLAELARRCWEAIQTENARLRVETDRVVETDERRLERILTNLFANAVEHGSVDGSDPPGELTITVGDLEDGFYVADDGTGVGPAEREAVFDRGYSTGDGSPGFGLAIVDRLVAAHGWSISLEESADGGARFEIHTGAGNGPGDAGEDGP